MNRLKFLYTILIGTVVFLLVFLGYSVISQAISNQEEPATITTQALVEVENQSVTQLVISNKEGHDINYKICTNVNNSTRCFWQRVGDGKRFTYRHHDYPKENEKMEVTVTVYKEDEVEPIDQVTYFIGGQQ